MKRGIGTSGLRDFRFAIYDIRAVGWLSRLLRFLTPGAASDRSLETTRSTSSTTRARQSQIVNRKCSAALLLLALAFTAPAQPCELYPIALSARALAGATPGTVLKDIWNGAAPGNFGWLTWNGSPSEPTLVQSLTPPGDSDAYVDPDKPGVSAAVGQVKPGDWVQAKPGVSNSKAVRRALDLLKTRDIIVPVCDLARGQGAHAAYRVCGFARIRLLNYDLPRHNRITARFLGYVHCNTRNAPPAADAGPDLTLSKPAGSPAVLATLAGTVADDGLPYGAVLRSEWSQVSGPALAILRNPAFTNRLAGVLATNPVACDATFTDPGIYVFQLLSTDSEFIATDHIIVTVNRPNREPAPLPQILSTDEDLPLGITLAGTDPDGDAVNFAIVRDPEYGRLTGIPPNLWYAPNPDWNGTDAFEFKVDDGFLESSNAAVTIHVLPVNDPPVADAQSITNCEDTTFEVVLSGSDVEGNPLAYEIIDPPLHGLLAPNLQSGFANEFIYIPARDFFGRDTFRFRVDDGTNSSAPAMVEITLLPVEDPVVNAPPTVDAGTDFIATVGETVWLRGIVSDDGIPSTNSLTAAWSLADGHGLHELDNPTNPITTARFLEVGTYEMRLTATDSMSTNSDEVTIIITPINRAPVVNAGPKQLVVLPANATLRGTITDDGLPLGAPVTCRWTQAGGPGAVAFSEARSTNATAAFSEPGDYVLRLTASDTALTGFANVQVRVRTPSMNEQPRACAGPDLVIGLTNVATLHGSVTDDGLPQDVPVLANWTVVSGPGQVKFSPDEIRIPSPASGSTQPATTKAVFSTAGTYVLRLTAGDSEYSAGDEVTVTVHPFNQPPVVDAGPDQTITVPDPAVLVGSGTTPAAPNVDLATALAERAHWDHAIGQPGLTGIPVGGFYWVRNVAVENGQVYAAGGFTMAGTNMAKSIARWDGAAWHNFYDTNDVPFTCGDEGSCSGPVVAWLVFDCTTDFCSETVDRIAVRGQEVFAGGVFKDLGNLDGKKDRTARWDGARWHSWDPKISAYTVYDLETARDKVYVGGQLIFQPTNASPQSFTNLPWSYGVAVWDGTNWGTLGSGIVDIRDYPDLEVPGLNHSFGYATSLAVAANGDIYAAGMFTMPTPGGCATNIAKWNGHQWQPLGGGIRFNCGDVPTSLCMAFAENGDLFVAGGNIISAGGIPVHDIARWDGARWWPLAYGTNEGVLGEVHAIATHGRDLYVAGAFNQAGGVEAGRFARWDGQFWRSVSGTAADGPDGSIYALAVDDTGVYVGGNFHHIGGSAANGISKWVFPKSVPRVAMLNGRVTDDGLPIGGIPGATWTKVSGPGEVTFADPHHPCTTAAFERAGTYVLRLTADDTECTAWDETTVVVHGNQPPSVNAGPDQVINPSESAALHATLADDGLPQTAGLANAWSVINGPGEVTFDPPTGADTTARFSQSGIYVLRFSVNDSQFTVFDDLAITVLGSTHDNDPPYCHAGFDRTVPFGSLLTLVPLAVQDDGLPANITRILWAQVSGPGAIRFGSPTNASTTAEFTAPGLYVVRLNVDDTELASYMDVKINVTMPANTPPKVTVGPPQTLTNPPFTLLTGSVRDDGLPAGMPLTVCWSKYNGPGDVRFANSNAPATYASFSMPGTYNVRLTASDSEYAAHASALVTVIVPGQPPAPGDLNQPPLVFAGPDQSTSITNPVALTGSVTDDGLPEGTGTTWLWSKITGPGPVYFAGATNLTTNLVTTALFIVPGEYVLRLGASDAMTSATDDINITVLPGDPNLAPVASAGPDFTVPQYEHRVLDGSVTDDLSPGGFAAVAWSRISGPAAVHFGNAAAVDSTVSFPVAGTYVLRLTATDGQATAYDDVVVTVVPPINDGPIPFAGNNLTVIRPNAALLQGTVYDDGLPYGYPLRYQWTEISGPGVVTFTTSSHTTDHAAHWEEVDGIDAFASATFSVAGQYVLSLVATDTEFTNASTVTVLVLPGTNSAPAVHAGPDLAVALPDDAILTTDIADDGLEEGWIELWWESVSGPGMVWFSTMNGVYRAAFEVPGEYVLRLTAHDGSLTNHDDVNITVRHLPPPVVQIDQPLDGAIITCPTLVIGTAASRELQSYALEYRLKPADESQPPHSDWSILASSTISVSSNSLGFLDPTLSLNGLYELRLTATDILGRSAVTEPVTVIFDRHLKIGHFTVAFDDLSVPVPGLPLQVTRTYDTRAAAAGIPGDFGIGWTMDIRNVRLQKSRPLSRNWIEYTTGSPWDLSLAYHLDPVRPRYVTITFPDDRVEKFLFEPRPLHQGLFPIHYPQWHFAPIGNTRGKLDPAGIDDPDGTFLIVDGAIPGTVNVYDLNLYFEAISSLDQPPITPAQLERYPTLFRYTTPDGTQYWIDEIAGLQTLVDPNGNTLVVSTNGLTWANRCAGTNTLAVAFQRDHLGRIIRILDAAGHGMAYAYDDAGNLAAFANRDGDTNGFTYDSNHRLLTMSNTRGVHTLKNAYDHTGRLVSSTDALGYAVSYGHDLDHRREYITNRLGCVTLNEYDSNGNVVRTTDPLGLVKHYRYDANGNLLVRSNASGCSCAVAYTYDSADNLASETDARGHTTTYTYNHLGKLLAAREPSGFVTTNEYDAAGNLVATRDSAGQTVTFSYDPCGKVTSVTDPRGCTSRFRYNQFGFLTNSINALGQSTDYTVDANGNLLTQAMTVRQITGLAAAEKRRAGWQLAGAGFVSPAGSVTNVLRLVMRYEYSNGGLPLRTLYYDGTGFTNVYREGKPIEMTDALGRTTACQYDDANRLTRKTYPDGCQEMFEYDAEGQLIAISDRRGFRTQFEYDPRGKLVRTRFADGSTTSATYNPDGFLYSETSKSGETTVYGLDADGNRVMAEDSAGVTAYTYDYRRFVTSKTDPLGRKTQFEYDALGRNTLIRYPDNTSRSATFSGRLVATETDQNGSTTSYAYDPLGRLISVTDPAGSSTSYQYDQQGNKIAATDGLGRTTYYEYDTMRRLLRTIHPDGTTIDCAYDAVGRLISKTGQMGDVTRFQYDPLDRLIATTDPLGRVTRRSYDCGGNILTETDAAGRTTAFAYDELSRLTATQFPDGTTTTAVYDLAGNPVLRTDQAGSAFRSTFDLKGRMRTSSDPLGNTAAFDYDAAGNLSANTDPLGQATRNEYDVLDRLIRTTHPDGSIREYAYDPAGRLTGQKDPAGKFSGFTYNTAGRLIGTIDAMGHPTTFAYDMIGRRVSQTDALGQVTRFEYDTMDRLTRTVQPDGACVSVTYDKAGLPVVRTDPLGNETAFTFDAAGQATGVRDALQQSTQSQYDAAGRLALQTDPNNRATAFEYDSLGRLTRTIYPDGTSSSATYDPRGWCTSTTDPLGNRTSYTYDGLGRLTGRTDALGQVETWSYDALGRLTAHTDVGKHTTLYEYDPLGRLTHVQYADGTSRSATYDPKGRCLSTTDPVGNTTQFEYDDLDRLLASTDPNGAVTQYEYDAIGRLVSVTDAKGRATKYEYDTVGRLIRTVYADGTASENRYDLAGRRVAAIDPAGGVTVFGYDPPGRLAAVTNALGQATSYRYDPAGQLLERIDPNGHVTAYGYDARGRRTSRTLPGGNSESLTHDAAGNVASRTSFSGHTTTFNYDALNRLISKVPGSSTLPGGGAPVEFTYTPTGRRASMRDATGTTTYAYDTADRLISKDGPAGTLAYSYNPNGNVTGITSSNPNGAAAKYEYDALGRLISAVDRSLGRTEYRYDAVGNVEIASYPNGITAAYEYTALDRLTSVRTFSAGAIPVSCFHYELGPAGNRLSALETIFGSDTNSQTSTLNRLYSYDATYQLTGEAIATPSWAPSLSATGMVVYLYDPAGNRLRRQSTVAALLDVQYHYDALDRLAGDSYDANGNTISAWMPDPLTGKSRQVSDQFDFEDRLAARQTTLNNQPVTIDLAYDGDGNRFRKTVRTDSEFATTVYLVDDLNPTGYPQVLEEISTSGSGSTAGGAVTRVYAYGLDAIGQEQLCGSQWVSSYYGQDGHGNVRCLTDPSGNITDTYDYDAFGNLIGTTGITPNERLFAGEPFDPDLGLYYLRARYADPDRGRFWTRDAFEGVMTDPASLHPYAFNRNDPVNRMDPSGCFSVMEAGMSLGIGKTAGQSIAQLWEGINRYAYGLAGGHALKFTSRPEAYMIDSLAAGPGWLLGKGEFWAAVQGAPFLLANNPNVCQARKTCWYECIPFDLDVPVYGPHAAHPIFEFDANPLASWVNGDQLSWWDAQGEPLPPAQYTDSFLQNLANNANRDAGAFSERWGRNWMSLADNLVRFGYAAATDPGRLLTGLYRQASDLVQHPGQHASRAAEAFIDSMQSAEGCADMVYGAQLAMLGSRVPLPGLSLLRPMVAAPLRAAAARLPSVAERLGARKLKACLSPANHALDDLLAKHPRLNPANWRSMARASGQTAAGELRRPTAAHLELAFENDLATVTAKAELASGRAIGKAASSSAKTQLEFGFVPFVERQNLARSFYRSFGWADIQIYSHLKGIDFEYPVNIRTIQKGTILVQHGFPGDPVGHYFAELGTPAKGLGIYPHGRIASLYRATGDLQVLDSIAADAVDSWSVPGWSISVPGGRPQLFVPEEYMMQRLR